MCIVCECDGPHDYPGGDFLTAFETSQAKMRDAVEGMARCRDAAATPAGRKRYDRAHKKMTRLLRDWNRTEQERECDVPERLQS